MLKEHPKEPGSHEETLWAVCDHLWSTKVRTTLIYGSSLELCRTCISFFDSKEKHDHPERDIVTVQQYFLANELTSLDKMVDFFKPPIRSTSSDSQLQQNYYYLRYPLSIEFIMSLEDLAALILFCL